MSGATTAVVIASTIAASAVYSGEMQKKAAKKQAQATAAAQRAQEEAAKQAAIEKQKAEDRVRVNAENIRQEELERDKRIRQNVVDSDTAQTVYGVQEGKKKQQVSSDLLIPKTKSVGTSLGGTSRTGLGF